MGPLGSPWRAVDGGPGGSRRSPPESPLVQVCFARETPITNGLSCAPNILAGRTSGSSVKQDCVWLFVLLSRYNCCLLACLVIAVVVVRGGGGGGVRSGGHDGGCRGGVCVSLLAAVGYYLKKEKSGLLSSTTPKRFRTCCPDRRQRYVTFPSVLRGYHTLRQRV